MNRVSWKAEWAPLARRFGGLTAVHDAAGPVTYAALYGAAAGVAAHLVAEGVRPGEVVGNIMPNGRHVVAASLGIALAGAAEAAVNPALAVEEAAHSLGIAGAGRLVTAGALVPRFAGLDPAPIAGDGLPPADLDDLTDLPVDPAAWGRVMFTSGTTGRPKGIVHSQGGRWLANLLLRASLPVAPAPGRAVLLMTPYAHGAGLMTQAFLDGGAAVRLLDGVDPDAVRGILERGEVDQVFAPPTVLAKLVEALEGRRFPGLSAIFCGTAPLSPELYRKARAIFGPVIRITYGKTEVFNPITVLTPAETDRWFADERCATSVCVGWPASGVEVVIRAPDDVEGRAAAPGEAGPVMLRAQHMLAATIGADGLEPHPPGGFHRTGDLGFFDEQGRLHLVGREADVIKTGGYRVTPEEIEGHLRPALERGELVVLGLPSSYWGEIVTVVAAGAPAGWREALRPAVERMTRYKRPRLFAEVPEISRNALGKVVRARGRDAVLARYELVDGRYPELRRRAAADSAG